MKNSEKYKTAEKRIDAFNNFCFTPNKRCETCKLYRMGKCRGPVDLAHHAFAHWLELEAEKEQLFPLPCPYCGKECKVTISHYDNCGVVECRYCGYQSGHIATKEGAIERHNRIVRIIRDCKEENQ